MGKLVVLTLLGAVLALIGERLVAFRQRMNASRAVEPVDLPNCHLIEGLENGSEDIDILPNGLAFISSYYLHRFGMIKKLCEEREIN